MDTPSAPIGPSVWVVSDGRAGIERQALAIARALGDPNRWYRLAHLKGAGHRSLPIRLTPRAPQVWLPPAMWPMPLAALPQVERDLLRPPWPNLWIAAGRRSLPYSASVRRWSEGSTFVVQTQDPKMDVRLFDMVVPPEHDQVEGDNVFPILGSPVYFEPGAVEAAEFEWAQVLLEEPSPRVIVIIGGKSKTHDLSPARAAEILSALEKLAHEGARLWITTSRRTPAGFSDLLRAFAAETGQRFWADPVQDGPNPYVGWLRFADAALVTEDSANLLSDAAYFGLPIHLLKMDGGAPKFDRLHAGFIARGAARWFEGSIDTWDYDPVQEVSRVADALIAILKTRQA